MNLLAIDTSGTKLLLGLSFGEDRIVKIDEKVEQSHGQIIIKKIEELLGSAGLKPNQLSAIIVNSGPGSFTGLRIGLSAAKGIATAVGIPMIEINLFELAAFKLKNVKEPVTVVTPLKKDEFFTAVVENGLFDSKIEVVSDSDLENNLSGQVAFINFNLELNFKDTDFNDCSKYVDYNASDLITIGKIKFNSNKISDIETLEPLYVQKSQAEINYDKRNQK